VVNAADKRIKPQRNDPCSCGSGRKYKKCCGGENAGTAPAMSRAISMLETRLLAKLYDAGQFAQLEARTRELTEREPSAGIAWKLMGIARGAQGKDALEALQRAAHLMPNDAEVHSNLGNALRGLAQFDAAVSSYRRATQIRPDYALAYNNMGSAQLDTGQPESAAASFRAALRIKPRYAAAHCNLVIALRLLGRVQEAHTECRAALEACPNSAMLLAVLAELRANQGQFQEAEDLLKRAQALEPELPDAWIGVPRLRRMTRDDVPWLAGAQRLASQSLAPRKQAAVQFAMGKYFDDVEQFERAFAHYREGNELSKGYTPRYDPTTQSAFTDQAIRFFDHHWLSRARHDEQLSQRPVFIVGMPRSGTTLAEQILASHPGVCGAGELSFWFRIAAAYTGTDVLETAARDYLQLLQTQSVDALRVVDKLPINFMYLGLIHAAFPRSRIIHMTRNPVDTCLSIYFQSLSAAHAYANDLPATAHFYGEYVRLMRHWRRTLPLDAMLDVSYEELVEDPEDKGRAMVEFIGLPWDSRCLDSHKTPRTIVTASLWQARQKINRSSVERWRHYEPFLAPLLHLGVGS
jgi:tetratricopeptide (TPR) repeat protein